MILIKEEWHVLIQHTGYWSKSLILIKEDWQESNRFFYEMANNVDASSRTYLYNQPCGLWNEECCHGCGYIHLSSSTSSTKKKCWANGALSSVSVSHNFDEELKMRFGMDEMPLFMKSATTRRKFCQDCTKYNNLFAMAATKVCNYCDNSGFTN
jgi:hypothetical protein